jgi:hypothetical protein
MPLGMKLFRRGSFVGVEGKMVWRDMIGRDSETIPGNGKTFPGVAPGIRRWAVARRNDGGGPVADLPLPYLHQGGLVARIEIRGYHGLGVAGSGDWFRRGCAVAGDDGCACR